ncbi:hypothetical protein ES703_75753 [subsurface metagenome]
MISTYGLVYLVFSLAVGSGQQSAVAQRAKNTAESPAKANQALEPSKVSPKPTSDAKNLLPRILFEKTVCDLGDVGQGTKNTCEFKFTNTGSADGGLKIGKIKRTCGCTVFELDRKEYAPGQKGTIRVSYIAGKATALRQKHIYVPSNDKDNPNVKLTIKARVVQLIEATPQKFQLSLRKESAGIPDIRLTSKDGRPFSIKGFKSTNNGIVTDFDPNVSAPEFVLHPKVDVEKLKTGSRGYIEIQLTHPQCPSVRIPYEILAEFKATPGSIIVMNTKPQEVVTREITVVSNYDEDFEVESTSSKNGYIKVLSREKAEKAYKFKVQVTPPSVNKRSLFSDTFYVGIKGKDKLAIACRGFYSRHPTDAKKPDKSNKGPVKFKAEPQVVKIRNAEPERPLIKEVWVYGSDNEDFQIESTDSQKGTIQLLSQKKLGNRYKLKLKITPPPTKYRLKIFSDVLYVNIRSNKTKDQTIKLPITCRGSYSRRPRK